MLGLQPGLVRHQDLAGLAGPLLKGIEGGTVKGDVPYLVFRDRFMIFHDDLGLAEVQQQLCPGTQDRRHDPYKTDRCRRPAA